MLILARRTGESIRIGDDIVLTVLSIQGSQVRIGLRAPKGVALHREEVYLRLQEASQEILENCSVAEKFSL